MPALAKIGPERREQMILEAHPEIDQLALRAERIVEENTSFKIKSRRLYKLADEMKEMLAPFVACSSGCSYCCHMPTFIYQHEADAMAAASGRRARQLKHRPPHVAFKAGRAFNGHPCPFLSSEGRCSIYEHRPLICRVHNSLADDPDVCRVEPSGPPKPRPCVDPDRIEEHYHVAARRARATEGWGVIQEFFPPER